MFATGTEDVLSPITFPSDQLMTTPAMLGLKPNGHRFVEEFDHVDILECICKSLSIFFRYFSVRISIVGGAVLLMTATLPVVLDMISILVAQKATKCFECLVADLTSTKTQALMGFSHDVISKELL